MKKTGKQPIIFHFTILTKEETMTLTRTCRPSESFKNALKVLDEQYDLKGYQVSTHDGKILNTDDLAKSAEFISQKFGDKITLTTEEYKPDENK